MAFGINRSFDPTYGGDHVSAQTTTAHGLEVGNVVFLEGVQGEALAPPTAVAGSAGTSDRSSISHMSVIGTFSRTAHKGVRLEDGQAMFVGGYQVLGTPDTTPVLFRTLAETFDRSGRRQVTYEWDTLALSPTISEIDFGISTDRGRVVVTGGADSSGTPSNAWDIITYSRTPLVSFIDSGTMPTARAAHGQAVLGTTLLVCGGFVVDNVHEVATAYKFDLNTLAWTAAPSMSFARMNHEAVTVGANILVAGGKRGSDDVVLSTCELWDGTAWTQVGSMQFARYNYTAVPLPGNRVLVLGGRGYDPSRNPSEGVLRSCEIWDGTSRLWARVPDMLYARERPAAVYIPSLNAVLVSGGSSKTLDILDLGTLTWKRSLAAPDVARDDSVAVYVGETDTAVFAGGSTAGVIAAKNYLFVPAAEVLDSGGINGLQVVTDVPDATTFVFKTPGYTGLTSSASGEEAIYPVGAIPSPASVPGPYVFDPKEGIAITGTVGLVETKLEAGRQYLSLELTTSLDDPTPALRFPDSAGWLVFHFGHENQIWPVKYLGQLSDSELSLDASFRFPFEVPAGSTVHLATQRAPFAPGTDEPVAALYATASSAGRVAAVTALDDTVAAGVTVNEEIVYSGDRGLGAEGFPTHGEQKLSDQVRVWGGDFLENEVPKASKE